VFTYKHASKQRAHTHSKAIEDKLKSLASMLCVPTPEYKQLVEKKQLTPRNSSVPGIKLF